MSKGYSKTPTGLRAKWLGFSLTARVGVLVAAGILLAAILFAIIWFNIDHSFPYDRADLTPYIKTVDVDTAKTLPISLNTDVTEDAILDKVQANILALGSLSLLKKTDVPAKSGDILYLYYRVLKHTLGEAGEVTASEEVFSNKLYADPAKAMVLRLGSGDLNSEIETKLIDGAFKPEQTPLIRKTSGAWAEGDTLSLTLKGTYQKDGAENTYLDLTAFYVNPETGKIVADNTVDALLKAELAGKAVGEDLSFTLNISPTGEGDPVDVAFTGKIGAAFTYDEKVVSFKLTKELKYKDSAGADKTIPLDTTISVYFVIENTVVLDQETVMAIDDSDDAEAGYIAKDGMTTDEQYAADYIAYVKNSLINAYVSKYKADNADSFKSDVKQALWEEICGLFAVEGANAVLAYPAGTVEQYCEVALQNYKYEYYASSGASTNQKSYATLELYILAQYKDTQDVATLSNKELNERIRGHLETEAKEQIRRKLVLYSMADTLGITISKADYKKRLEDLRASYVSYYTSYYTMVNQYTNTEYTAEYIAYLAATEADNTVKGMTEKYVRETIYFDKVLDSFLTGGDYSYITWELAKAD